MSLLNKLEPKYGRFAFPNLIQTIAVFWILTYVLAVINPGVIELMVLDVGEVLKGQIWRLFTYILIAPASSTIGILFAVYFTFFLGQLLERAWGAFRVNCFVFSGMFLIAAVSSVVHFTGGMYDSAFFAFIAGRALSASILLSCACIYPELVIRVMGLIPIKLKWIGLIDGGLILLMAFASYWNAFAVAVGLLPFLIIFVPVYLKYAKNRATAAARLQRFKESSRSDEETLHHCAICHKTENEDPDLDFRVSGGVEYCVPCLEEKKKAEAETGSGPG